MSGPTHPLIISALGSTNIANTEGATATATGTYGTLVLGRDGSVTYNADQAAANDLAFGDDAVTDTFTYTVSDGNGGTDTAQISFSVTAPNPGNAAPTAADNTVTINEDASITFTPDQFNYSDADGDSMKRITIVTLPSAGTLDLAGSQVNAGDSISIGEIENLSFTPAGNGNGDPYASFTFRVNDGTADSAEAYTMAVNVLPMNDAPTASNATVTIDEDTTKTFAASEFNFTDTLDDGDTLDHITIATLPATGTLTLSGSAVEEGDDIAANQIENLVYTPVANGNGDPYTSFTFTVNDGTADSASSYTMTVDVTPVNDAPTAANNTVTTNEDTAHTFAASEFNFADVDSDSLDHVTIATLPATGTLTLSGSAVEEGDDIAANQIENLVYTPVANGNGDPYTSFTFTVNDGTADSASSYTMTVDVTPVNDAPVVSAITATKTENDSSFVTDLTAGQTDPEDDDLSVASPVITAVDGNGDSYTLPANTASVSGNNLTVDPTQLNGLDDGESVVITVTYDVSDGTATTQNTATVTVTGVNDAPTAADNAVTINEDTAHTFAASEFNFADVDGDSLDHVTIATLPATGTLTLSGSAVEEGDDIAANQIENLVYTPVANGNGDPYTSFTFTVNDGTADSASSYTMTVDVTPVNDAPVVSAITATKTENDSSFVTDLTAGQTDPEDDDLSVASPVITAVDGNGDSYTLPANTASVSGNNLTVDPTQLNGLDDGESVVITVTYDVSDGTATTQNTATVTVTGVNDAPTISPLTNANEKTDADYSFDLLQGAEDVDGDTLSVSGTPEIVFTDKDGNEVPLPTGAAVINGNNVEISPGVFSALDADEDVTIAINYNITDGDEIVANTATITISGENTPPRIIDDNDTPEDTNDDQSGVASVRTNEDTPLVFNADSFNFSDQDERDTLSHVTILTLPESGSLRLGDDLVEQGDVIPADQIGNLTFKPDDNDNGEDYASFRYTVSDGTENSDPGTMSIHVDAVNDAPTSANGNLQLNGDDEIPLSEDNFTFVDIDEDELATVTIVTAPTEGTLYLNNQPVQDGDVIPASRLDELSYEPGDDASGENYDAFTFTVGDGETDSADTYTMNIGVNAAPEAQDGALDVNEGAPTRGTMLADDPDDTNLRYEITKQPDHGTLELINGGPEYIYTPAPYYNGPDSFKFTASDGSLTSEEAAVSIDVEPVNNAPIERLTVPSQAIMLEGKVKPIKLADFFGDVDAFDPSKRGFERSVTNLFEKGTFPNSAKFSDIPPAGALTFSVESELPPGLTFNGESISGRPTAPGVYEIVMVATDGLGESAKSTFKLFVGMPVTEVIVEAPTKEPQMPEDVKPEEEVPDLNDHDLPKVLKVKPKRDGTVPVRETLAPETIAKEDTSAALGDSAGLSDDGWMNTTVSSEQDVSGNIRVVDLKVEGEEIAVQISDEAVDQAETFKGEMADGSKLPDWVKVDPSTGLTTAEPPQGATAIEMRVIAEDSSGNERAIDLVLNPEALRDEAQDNKPLTREERREARQAERQEQREARQAERQEQREVRQAERQARIEAREERRAERAENRAIREVTRSNTEVSVLSDGRVKFAEGLTAAGEGSMKLMRMVSAPEAVTIEITDEARAETTRYEVRQQDGTAAPDWVQVDVATGELIIEAPQDSGTLQLTLVAIDGSQQRSIDLEVNLDEMREEDEAQLEDAPANSDEIEAEEPTAPEEQELGQFLPLDAQIDAALADNNYGQDLQTALRSRL